MFETGGGGGVNAFTLVYRSSNARLRVSNYTDGSNYKYREYDLSGYANTFVDLLVVSQGASVPLVYVNGLVVAPTSGTDTNAGSAPAWSVVETRTYTDYQAVVLLTNLVALSAEYGNVALTAAEVGLLHAFGWAALPWMKQSAVGGNGAALYTSDFSAGVDGWSAVSSASLAAASSKLEITADTLGKGAQKDVGEATGEIIRVRFKHRIQSGSFGSWEIRNTTSSAYFTLLSGASVFTPTSSEGEVDAWFYVANSTGNLYLRQGASGSGVLEIYDFTVTKSGLCGSWDFNTGAGFQQRDLSGAGNRMTLTTTGVSRLMPADYIDVAYEFDLTGTTPAQMIGQSVLPDLNWRLEWATAESDTSINFALKDASGGTDLVASEALTADTPKDLTIASGIRIPTTLNVWGVGSATALVKVTMRYSKISTQA